MQTKADIESMDDNTPLPRKKKRWLGLLLLVVAIVSVPIFYLNCAGPMPSSYDANSVAASAPFAFQMKIDTLAYMSCTDLSTTNYDPNSIFNFKVGAFRSNSGLSLLSTFTYDIANLSLTDKQTVLATSPANANLYPDLSVRMAADLQHGQNIQYWQAAGPKNADADLLGPQTLSAPSIDSTLLSGSELDWHNSTSASTGEIPLSGAISFPGIDLNSQTNAEIFDGVGSAIRGVVTSGTGPGYLVTEFATNGTGDGASTNGTSTSIYGNGYRFSFGFGPGQTGGATRAVTGVTEYDLTTGAPTGSSWSCQSYVIVYPGDIGVRTSCPSATINPTPSTTLQQALLDVLPAGSYKIDFANRCVIPQWTTGPNSGQPTPFCEGTLQMHPGSYSESTINYTGSCDPTQNTCPHDVSVCVRN